MNREVRVRRETAVFPTYRPAEPDRNPMFLEKRVYQGSSGRVYPLPVIDRIAESPEDHGWQAVILENSFISLMMLPEIGGRIHAGRDLTNGYEFFYRQNVIKPALVGLAGPWASGGVEFNWPQHHRPSTFMPTDVEIEHADDGSITVWMSEHEPMNRMKGMHGVCLHPDRSVVELKVRLYNRTPYVQTFLWWANIATHVHEAYQSFFPPDVHTVADHAKRATSSYPLCESRYYGVDYGSRATSGVPKEEQPTHFLPAHSGGTGPAYAPNDLSWYANIPVPTSYMCLGSKQDFFGGYDYFKEAGLIHVADHHIAPGKKQWTWGNHPFGYAWDKNLTDQDGPYIEIMAGVYTDNQPDFSFLAPGETKTFSQFWYPYAKIGPVHHANVDAALSLVEKEGKTTLGVAVTRPFGNVSISAAHAGVTIEAWNVDLVPGSPWVQLIPVSGPVELTVRDANGNIVANYENRLAPKEEAPQPATEPPLPADVASNDELFLIGQHLDQYRHATREAAPYWREALSRDPGDSRAHNSLGLWHFKRGEFEEARGHFDAAIARATHRNPNPYDGEAYYNLGILLRFEGKNSEAKEAFGKAIWNAAWQSAGYLALAELASLDSDWRKALEYIERSIRKDADQMRARGLKGYILQQIGKTDEAEAVLLEILAEDPVDHLARFLLGESVRANNGTRMDLVIDLWRAGAHDLALQILEGADFAANDGTVPMIAYYKAFTQSRLGVDFSESLQAAAQASPDYCFPARLEDIQVLEFAIVHNFNDARARFYLGNLMYDRRRYTEAIALWEASAQLDDTYSVVHRNLGIAYFNVSADPARAKAAYDLAVAAAPHDARLWFERDQLWKRIGVEPQERYEQLAKRSDLVLSRDDLTIEWCALLNALGKSEQAAEILARRTFQPWEGGEGQALGAFTRTHLALARRALQAGESDVALKHLTGILSPPTNLAEARHLLANASDVWLLLGDALQAVGEEKLARFWYQRAAEFNGDFQDMAVRDVSEMTYFQALAQQRLGDEKGAADRFRAIDAYADQLLRTPAKIDFFATSLPTMLLFNDDLQARQDNSARFLKAQAAAGLGNNEAAERLLQEVLIADPNHALAQQLRDELNSLSKGHQR